MKFTEAVQSHPKGAAFLPMVHTYNSTLDLGAYSSYACLATFSGAV